MALVAPAMNPAGYAINNAEDRETGSGFEVSHLLLSTTDWKSSMLWWGSMLTLYQVHAEKTLAQSAASGTGRLGAFLPEARFDQPGLEP